MRAKQAFPHGRIDPVGANNNIGLDLAPISKRSNRRFVAGQNAGAARVGAYAAHRQQCAQQPVEIGTVHGEIGRPEVRNRSFL
jgi:hypothetical protein